MFYSIIYVLAIMLLACGLFIIIISNNYVKKIIGLGIFQSSVLIFYIALGKNLAGISPIIKKTIANSNESSNYIYSSPLPHVLMLTAIVVGFATLSVALALIYRIYINFGTIYENEIE